MKIRSLNLAIAAAIVSLSVSALAQGDGPPRSPPSSNYEDVRAHPPADLGPPTVPPPSSTDKRTVAPPVKKRGSDLAQRTKYLITLPHPAQDHQFVLEDLMNAKVLEQWDWGCETGDHTGYLFVDAGSEEDALASVPLVQRGNARVQRLQKFTPEEVRAFRSTRR